MTEFWNGRYNEDGFAYGTEPNDFLVAKLSILKPNSKILCLAEGEGRNAVFLASKGHSCHCVDLSKVGLEKAVKLAKDKGVLEGLLTTQVIDLDHEKEWVKEDEYDVVISIWCHLPDTLRVKTHSNILKTLKKGGVLILEAYTPANIGRGTGGPHQSDMCMTTQSLSLDFASRMDITHLQETERLVKEGKYHQGLSATVQLTAIKL